MVWLKCRSNNSCCKCDCTCKINSPAVHIIVDILVVRMVVGVIVGILIGTFVVGIVVRRYDDDKDIL